MTPAALLQLAHHRLMNAPFESRLKRFTHPAPRALPHGGTPEQYAATWSYPGVLCVYLAGEVVAVSRAGMPDAVAPADPSPSDPFTTAERAALLRKAAKAMQATAQPQSQTLTLQSEDDQAEAPAQPVQALFMWPGVLRILAAPGGPLLAVSVAGYPYAPDPLALAQGTTSASPVQASVQDLIPGVSSRPTPKSQEKG